ncbi:MAG: lactate utilization protein C [Bacteroidetes bacterium]|jgi:L-lactate dehydrogenase complex protein LldG|nr:lactate utilization protein C [Bacteroidota bacterium]
MSDAKTKMLATIRKALSEVPDSETPDDVELRRDYKQKGNLTQDEIVDLFAERVGEYKASVRRVKESNLKKVIAECCKKENVTKLVIPEGFQKELLPVDIDPLFDDFGSPLSHHVLDQSDGVITTCAYAVAQTGTIILDAGEGQGRRALTLVPDYHLCIVREDQIVELIPEGFSVVESSVKNEGSPITFISGPSATSDIELSRVEGVHGPRRLEVLIIEKNQN